LRCVNCVLVVFRARNCRSVVPSLCFGRGVAMACLMSVRNCVASAASARCAYVVRALPGQLDVEPQRRSSRLSSLDSVIRSTRDSDRGKFRGQFATRWAMGTLSAEGGSCLGGRARVRNPLPPSQVERPVDRSRPKFGRCGLSFYSSQSRLVTSVPRARRGTSAIRPTICGHYPKWLRLPL